MHRLATVLLFAAALPLAAQQKPFDFYSSADLQQHLKAVMAKAVSSPNGSAGETLSKYPDHILNVNARIKSGGPEIHQQYTDVMTITDGKATLVLGGTVVGQKAVPDKGPGEFIGDTITNGTEQVVQKGDVINIPAGTPHWIKLAPGDHFAYFNVKVKK